MNTEKLKLYVSKKTPQLSALELQYNTHLNDLLNAFKLLARQQELVFEIENYLLELKRKLKKENSDLSLLTEVLEQAGAKEIFTRAEFENIGNTPEEIARNAVFGDFYKSQLKDVAECKFAISETKRNINKIKNDKIIYTKMKADATALIEGLKLKQKELFLKLKTSCVQLEHLLGFSIGSHFLSWCTDDDGSLVDPPQLRPVEIIERQTNRQTSLVPVKVVLADEKE